ncbi:MAG: hypothetical protein J6S85_06380 [Methanobrevibacter sp.]|nr:hypothetical protein [Methanobrevibacter sp.]
MSEILLIEQALNDAKDLQEASSVAKYGLGQTIVTIDENDNVREYIYVKAGADIDAKDCVIVTPTFETATPATAAFTVIGGVANYDVAEGSYFFLQIKGKTTVVSAGATTEGNTGKLTNGATTVTDESDTTQTAKTFGVILTTLAAAGDAEVLLFGIGQQI